MGLYNGKNFNFDVVMTYIRPTRNSCSKEQGYVLYSIHTGDSLNRGHYIKGNHPLSKHAFVNEILNTTKLQGGLKNASKCTSLKVLHLNGSLRIRFRYVLHKMLSILFIPSRAFISL